MTLTIITLLLGLITADPGAGKKTKLKLFEQDGLWGYEDTSGKVVLAPQYFTADEFNEAGIAAVADKTGWVYIDMKGAPVIRPFVYDNGPDPFSHGLARYVEGGKYGFFDASGAVKIKAAWDFAGMFSDSLARVCTGCKHVKVGDHTKIEGGAWGFIDRNGALVIPQTFQYAQDFDGGTAQVKLKDVWITIDGKGEPVKAEKK